MEPRQPGNINTDAMSAIQEALARRGMGDSVPALNQQSQGSPTASPLPPEASGGMSAPTSMPTTEALPPVPTLQGNPEAKMIIGALRERLKAISASEAPTPPMQSEPLM